MVRDRGFEPSARFPHTESGGTGEMRIGVKGILHYFVS